MNVFGGALVKLDALWRSISGLGIRGEESRFTSLVLVSHVHQFSPRDNLRCFLLSFNLSLALGPRDCFRWEEDVHCLANVFTNCCDSSGEGNKAAREEKYP